MRIHTIALVAPFLVLAACAQQGEQAAPTAPPAHRVELPSGGLALASVPEGFEVATAGPEAIELTRAAADDPSLLTIDVGPIEEAGINLVTTVQNQRQIFEAMPGGAFHGSQELNTQLGPAYTARGSFDEDGTRWQETRVLATHPLANRLITVTYRYPDTDDPGVRVQELIAVLGEIEPLAPAE